MFERRDDRLARYDSLLLSMRDESITSVIVHDLPVLEGTGNFNDQTIIYSHLRLTILYILLLSGFKEVAASRNYLAMIGTC